MSDRTDTRQVRRRFRYQVSVAGVLGPMLRAAFRDLHVVRRPASTVLRVTTPPGGGPADIAARLEQCGLVVETMRKLPPSHPRRTGTTDLALLRVGQAGEDARDDADVQEGDRHDRTGRDQHPGT